MARPLSEAHSNRAPDIVYRASDQTQEVMPTVKTDPAPIEVYNTAYRVSNHSTRSQRGALVDRGANGGIIGNDARVIHTHLHRKVDVTGIDNHELNSLKIIDAVAKCESHRGPVLLIMRHYAYHGQNRTIHSSGQMEYNEVEVQDKSMRVGGKQYIKTLEGYYLPLDIISGLPYLKMYPPTDAELALPQVFLTSGDPWDPKVLDNMLSNRSDWYNIVKDIGDKPYEGPFDEHGEYKKREPATKQPTAPTPLLADNTSEEEAQLLELEAQFQHQDIRHVFEEASNLNKIYVCENDSEFVKPETVISAQPKTVKTAPPDYKKYRPYFLQVPEEKVRKTFENTTQYAIGVNTGKHITNTFKSPFPAHNVWRRNEPVASDTIFA